MVDSSLCYLSASEALSLFKKRELSPVDLLRAQLDRVQEVEPHINAFCSLRADQAMEQAKSAEQLYLRNPELARPLEGIPTVLKNEHTLIGEHTDQGSLIFGHEPDAENAPITQRLLDAGAVIHARTNVPEFYVAGFTNSRRYGPTRNPWNPIYTCGGSSGGSAASLAAGTTTLASCSDIGGSIRVPSAYCGVVGLKPSYGRVPESNFFFAMNSYNHNGVMARSVADCALMFNVVNGPHRADPATISPKIELPIQAAPVRGMRIAFSVDLGFFDVHPEIERNTREAAARLREQGAIVEEIQLAWKSDVKTAFTNGLVFLLGRSLQHLVVAHPDQVNDYVKDVAKMAQGITVDDYLASFEVMGQMHLALQEVFDRYDAMICPTLARNETLAEGAPSAHDDLLNHAMTYPFNMLSRHPVLNVPSGHSKHGVPTGLQIIGPTYQEEKVMQIGQALELSIGWAQWRPSL